MKVLYLSFTGFLDSDLLLVEQLQKICDLHYVLRVQPRTVRATLADINPTPNETGLYEMDSLPNLNSFANRIDMAKSHVIYRNSPRFASIETIKAINILCKYVKKLKPDIIHVIGIQSFDFARFLLWNRIPIIQTMHDPIPHSSDVCLKDTLQRSLNDFFINDKIILNAYQYKEYIKKSGLNPNNVFISRMGPFEYMEDLGAHRKKGQKRTIFSFGRIEKYKGFEYLIKAFNKISSKYPDVELTIIGRGNIYWDKTLHENNNRINIINRFASVEEIAQSIATAECVVCPYKDATQSGVLMTAYGLKTPVIATRVGSFPEFIKDKENGFLAAPSDVDSLAKALDKYLAAPELRTKFSNRIQKDFFYGKYSWKKIAENTLAFYEKCIATRK